MAEQLDKVLDTFSILTNDNPEALLGVSVEVAETVDTSKAVSQAVGSLATYLKAKGATTNQSLRFLATAAWLAKRGQRVLATPNVSKALKDNHQTKLTNPSDCLNKNVSQGFCEKNGKDFHLTPEGWEKLGDSI